MEELLQLRELYAEAEGTFGDSALEAFFFDYDEPLNKPLFFMDSVYTGRKIRKRITANVAVRMARRLGFEVEDYPLPKTECRPLFGSEGRYSVLGGRRGPGLRDVSKGTYQVWRTTYEVVK